MIALLHALSILLIFWIVTEGPGFPIPDWEWCTLTCVLFSAKINFFLTFHSYGLSSYEMVCLHFSEKAQLPTKLTTWGLYWIYSGNDFRQLLYLRCWILFNMNNLCWLLYVYDVFCFIQFSVILLIPSLRELMCNRSCCFCHFQCYLMQL